RNASRHKSRLRRRLGRTKDSARTERSPSDPRTFRGISRSIGVPFPSSARARAPDATIPAREPPVLYRSDPRSRLSPATGRGGGRRPGPYNEELPASRPSWNEDEGDMTDWAIRVKDLRKQYPGRDGPIDAVNGLDLEVPIGECFGLLGPNGAGKTTTVEILEGLNQPTSGYVEVLGRHWETDEAAIRERIGVTLQETRFPEKATVYEMLGLFRSFYNQGVEPETVLARVALESKSNAFVETLSGGQQRRMAVAVALVGDPELLFLDEPTTGLDPQSRRQLWDVIGELKSQGR